MWLRPNHGQQRWGIVAWCSDMQQQSPQQIHVAISPQPYLDSFLNVLPQKPLHCSFILQKMMLKIKPDHNISRCFIDLHCDWWWQVEQLTFAQVHCSISTLLTDARLRQRPWSTNQVLPSGGRGFQSSCKCGCVRRWSWFHIRSRSAWMSPSPPRSNGSWAGNKVSGFQPLPATKAKTSWLIMNNAGMSMQFHAYSVYPQLMVPQRSPHWQQFTAPFGTPLDFA